MTKDVFELYVLMPIGIAIGLFFFISSFSGGPNGGLKMPKVGTIGTPIAVLGLARACLMVFGDPLRSDTAILVAAAVFIGLCCIGWRLTHWLIICNRSSVRFNGSAELAQVLSITFLVVAAWAVGSSAGFPDEIEWRVVSFFAVFGWMILDAFRVRPTWKRSVPMPKSVLRIGVHATIMLAQLLGLAAAFGTFTLLVLTVSIEPPVGPGFFYLSNLQISSPETLFAHGVAFLMDILSVLGGFIYIPYFMLGAAIDVYIVLVNLMCAGVAGGDLDTREGV